MSVFPSKNLTQQYDFLNTFHSIRKSFEKETSPKEEHPLEAPKQFCQYKVVLLGESGVGKSSLAVRFVKEYFNEYEESTVGAAFMRKTVEFPNFTVKLDIWDTAGAEQFQGLTSLYYRGAQAVIIVYDVTNRESFDRVKLWIKKLRISTEVTIVAIVGNKRDMYVQRTVEEEEGLELANVHGFLFFETSAKTGFGVNELFTTIVKKLMMLDFLDEEEDTASGEVNNNCCCCVLF